MIQLPPVYRNEPSDVRIAEIPYHIADPELPRHWAQTGAGEGITVGIADTGVDATHPELEGKILDGETFVSRREGKGFEDGNDHGTHVAGIIAGKHVGVAPKAKLMIAKVLGDNGSGTNDGVARGINWLVDKGVDIINLSLGSPVDDAMTRNAVLAAKEAGVIVCIATGNERANHVGYPAQYGVGVGAVDRGLKLAWFSNRGKKVDIVGYGVDVYSSIPGGRYAKFSGTSMATPFITGIAANRLSDELKHIGEIITRHDQDLLKLETFVTDLGPTGFDTSYGRGFPDLNQAFYKRLRSSKPTKPNQLMVRVEDIAGGSRWAGMIGSEKVNDA